MPVATVRMLGSKIMFSLSKPMRSVSSWKARLQIRTFSLTSTAWPCSSNAFHVLDHVQERGDDPQIARDRRLQGQQRENPLLDLQIAPVDAVVVMDDDRRELDVLMLERLERAV